MTSEERWLLEAQAFATNHLERLVRKKPSYWGDWGLQYVGRIVGYSRHFHSSIGQGACVIVELEAQAGWIPDRETHTHSTDVWLRPPLPQPRYFYTPFDAVELVDGG